MSDIDNGGPAFPTRVPDVKVPPDEALEILKRCQGMTLRDYFAAHAPTPLETFVLKDHCAYRYRYADAMLEARKK